MTLSPSNTPPEEATDDDRLSELFELSETELRRELERAGESERWRAAGLPGVRLFEMAAGPGARAAETVLVRFAPGVSSPRHRHRGREATLILSGAYADEAGREFHPGDIDKRDLGARMRFARSSPSRASPPRRTAASTFSRGRCGCWRNSPGAERPASSGVRAALHPRPFG